MHTRGTRLSKIMGTLTVPIRGALARDKYFFYHINWTWSNGRATMVDSQGSNIDLPRGNQDPDLPITRKACHKAH